MSDISLLIEELNHEKDIFLRFLKAQTLNERIQQRKNQKIDNSVLSNLLQDFEKEGNNDDKKDNPCN